MLPTANGLQNCNCLLLSPVRHAASNHYDAQPGGNSLEIGLLRRARRNRHILLRLLALHGAEALVALVEDLQWGVSTLIPLFQTPRTPNTHTETWGKTYSVDALQECVSEDVHVLKN